MNLIQLFDGSMRARRDSPAVEWRGATLTFGDVEDASNRWAHLLRRRGFGKGDRLCVQLPNSLDLVEIFLACLKLGVLFVPINVLYRDRETAHIVSDAAPREVMTSAEVSELRVLAQNESVERPLEIIDSDDAAAIIYTSGTTGAAKGAVLTHGNFASNARNLVTAWQITASDRFLHALPLFHVHGLGNGLHCWLLSGCRMRLLERFDHRTAVDEFLDFEPTLFFGVPTMYVRLLGISDDAAQRIGRSARLFVSGSAALPAHVFDTFRERFGHSILERYGMTETLMTLSNPYAGERRRGTVGLPLPGLSVRIEGGELLVRGPTLFAGYWRQPEATAAAFTRDGYFRTGDVVSRSDDGYYTIEGRKSDVIISGGFNVYPREIEDLLLEQPGVREAAVAGVPDQVRGEVPVAFIAGEADLDELMRVCREQLASFKVPRRFTRVEALPRTALGKVQKHLLAAWNGEASPGRGPAA